MMDLATIKSLNDAAAKRARESGIQPLVFGVEAITKLRLGDINLIRPMPYIGGAIPTGWKRFNLKKYAHKRCFYDGEHSKGCFFIDTSGWGADDEPALSLTQACRILADIAQEENGRIGWAFTDMGQFQGHISAFVKKAD